MKYLFSLFMTIGIASSTNAGFTVYSCFTDGYEPGLTIDVLIDGDAFEMMTYNLMPDGSRANTQHFGSNVKTIELLQDGRTAVTGWDFSNAAKPDQASMIFDKDFKSGVFVINRSNTMAPEISSVSCLIK